MLQSLRKALPALARAALAGAALAVAWIAAPAALPAADRPNVVLIMADDAGFEWFSCYGSRSASTPNIDRLARDGVRFLECHSQPLCTPSRVRIMTGKYNVRNYTRFGSLEPGETTFASLFRAAGYRTAVAGKWQLGGRAAGVEKFGFETHCLWHLEGRPSRYWEPELVRDGVHLRDAIRDRYGPDVVCDFVVEFMRAHRDEPFLVYYPMILPHWPFVPTPDSPPGGSRERSGSYDVQAGGEEYFDDMIRYVDRLVGRVTGELDSLGIRDRTLVLFTADNGSATNIEATVELPGGRTRVVHGGKGFMTDAGTHVPLVCAWPGKVPAGRVSGALVDFADVLPTILDAASIERPDGLDGISFLPALLGADGPRREWVLCDFNPRPEIVNAENVASLIEKKQLGRAVRDREWKLYDDGRLYFLRDDIEERMPVMSGRDESADRARARLRKVLESLPELELP